MLPELYASAAWVFWWVMGPDVQAHWHCLAIWYAKLLSSSFSKPFGLGLLSLLAWPSTCLGHRALSAAPAHCGFTNTFTDQLFSLTKLLCCCCPVLSSSYWPCLCKTLDLWIPQTTNTCLEILHAETLRNLKERQVSWVTTCQVNIIRCVWMIEEGSWN